MFSQKRGIENEGTARFCRSCGYEIISGDATEVATERPPQRVVFSERAPHHQEYIERKGKGSATFWKKFVQLVMTSYRSNPSSIDECVEKISSWSR